MIIPCSSERVAKDRLIECIDFYLEEIDIIEASNAIEEGVEEFGGIGFDYRILLEDEDDYNMEKVYNNSKGWLNDKELEGMLKKQN